MNEESRATCSTEWSRGGVQRRVLWPVGIGAVSLALAAYQLLIVLARILMLGLSFILDGEPPSEGLFSGELLGFLVGSVQLLGFLISAVLLVAGILVWCQSRLAVGMHKAYAIIAIMLNLALPLTRFLAYPANFAIYLLVWQIWSATLFMIYPVFLLIWFARPKVKAETRLW